MTSEEQLKKIEYLAGLFFTPSKIAIMLDFSVKPFVRLCENEGSPEYRAYWKGYYEAEVQFREDVKRIAHLGSSPAQTLLGKMIDNHKSELIDQ